MAAARGKHSTLAIGALNFFLGWTFIGWIVALIWSLAAEPTQHIVYVSQNVNMPPYFPQHESPYGHRGMSQNYSVPGDQQYIERNGPPMNVTPPRRTAQSREISEPYPPWNG